MASSNYIDHNLGYNGGGHPLFRNVKSLDVLHGAKPDFASFQYSATGMTDIDGHVNIGELRNLISINLEWKEIGPNGVAAPMPGGQRFTLQTLATACQVSTAAINGTPLDYRVPGTIHCVLTVEHPKGNAFDVAECRIGKVFLAHKGLNTLTLDDMKEDSYMAFRKRAAIANKGWEDSMTGMSLAQAFYYIGDKLTQETPPVKGNYMRPADKLKEAGMTALAQTGQKPLTKAA